PGLELTDSAYLPSTQQFAAQLRCVAEKRQSVYVIDHENMTRIEVGGSPHRARVVGVGNDIALVRPVIHTLRQRISHAKCRSVCPAAGPIQLQRVVPRGGSVVRLTNRTEPFVWP